jgi:putative membrane protein
VIKNLNIVFVDKMDQYYSWIKAFHIITVISWMAGMLYLPRLFVYHTTAKKGDELDNTLKTMERRLLKFIINPAMIASIVLGLTNASIYGIQNLGIWFYVKMLAVLGLISLHIAFVKFYKNFQNNTNTHSVLFFKIINETVTLCMIICVIMVVVKPFE